MNNTAYEFLFDNEEGNAYQYFQFSISESGGGDSWAISDYTVQLSELFMAGTEDASGGGLQGGLQSGSVS